MSVTITPATLAGLRSVIWTFDAPEPPVHPALGNVSVGGAICVTSIDSVANDLLVARVAVTAQLEWKPAAAKFSARGKHDLGRQCMNLASYGAVTDIARHVARRGAG